MTKAASKGRDIVTGIDTSGAHPVEYRFARARKGNRHLTVVFANLAAPDDYGWSTGVLDDLRSNILWIRDRFQGGISYYLCREMDFAVERSVIELITKVMRSLDLTPNDVTLWGSSKGGSAALYFGLRYGFRNMVACVPQFLIGTFVRDVYPKVGRSMLGEGLAEENVRALDAVLPDLLRAGANPEANIYLVSSPQDEQYTVQVEPFLGLLQRYPNFNFIFSESPFITEHNKVTVRNVPPLLGIAYLLADGIAPRFGTVRNGYEEPDRDSSALDAFLAATAKVQQTETFPPPVVAVPAAGGAVPCEGSRFTGSAPGAVRVSVWENGKFLASPKVAPDGTWGWTPTGPWTSGSHRIKIFAVSPTGFHSKTTEVVFTADEAAAAGSAPHVPGQPLQAPQVTTPECYEQVMGAAVRFTGLAGGAAQVGFRMGGTLLGTCPVAADGRWTWDSGWAWQEGMHTVEVFAMDAAGAESPTALLPFAVLNAPAGAQPFGY
ncbi:hypothetical protein [Streptomyces sp. SAI-229]|jgi:hypothetical protein|uniref:hypothetical protein n=1 Tax=Streptomyces sp. SAI-229 TaxID=3377731 RepID=UPI003C7D6119